MEVDGRLILPRDVTCTAQEPLTCRLYRKPLHFLILSPSTCPYPCGGRIPVNYMAALPERYALNDFYIHTADGDGPETACFVQSAE